MYTQDARLHDLWNLDIIGIEDPVLKSTKEDHLQEVLHKFRSTTKTNETGRCEVFLPCKEDHPPLCKEIAKKRLKIH